MDECLYQFTQRVVHLARAHPVFQRRRWFKGRALRGRDVADIAWFRFDGEEMSEEEVKAVKVNLIGQYKDTHGRRPRCNRTG